MLPRDFTLLQVTPALDSGGVESMTLEVARAVAAAGAGSLVASRGGRLEAEVARSGARLIRLPLGARDPLSLALNAVRMTRVIKRERVDLVHVRSRAPMFSALAAARLTSVGILATYHGVYSAGGPLKRWYNAIMTRGDAVIANSAFSRDHILREHGAPAGELAIIPEGVDCEAFDPAGVTRERIAAVRRSWGVVPDRPILLVAARLTAWKGHRLFLDAAAPSQTARQRVLVFAGSGETSPYALGLVERARVIGLDLVLPGPCSDMPAAYLAADLVAAPSIQAESFGRTVAEAGAMGRLVLASRLGGPAETVVDGKTGCLVAPGDVAAWTRALDQALGLTAEQRSSIGSSARERICRHYSIGKMIEDTFALYSRLSERRN